MLNYAQFAGICDVLPRTVAMWVRVGKINATEDRMIRYNDAARFCMEHGKGEAGRVLMAMHKNMRFSEMLGLLNR